jgi:membrane-associated phospholipid phosphatase
MTLADDPVLVNTSIISLQSAGLAAGLSIATKKLVDRARPEDSGGNTWTAANKQSASFPSNHSAVTMAVLTPYAEEYQLPWLYVAGGLANAGRVAGNKHWVSDVVAGSLLGYAVGYQLWKGQRDAVLMPTASADGKSLALTLHKQY